MSSPILFLDIDGVLNSRLWYKNRKIKTNKNYCDMNTVEFWIDEIDPDAVILLNKIVEKTGCLIVISSAWRKIVPINIIAETLEERGFEFKDSIIDRTGSFCKSIEMNAEFKRAIRGAEIAIWLNNNRYDGCVFAILDDDSDMWKLMDRLVKTEHEFGLDEIATNKIIMLLNETKPIKAPMPQGV